eukprot:1430472-Amphidinium_carterae.1
MEGGEPSLKLFKETGHVIAIACYFLLVTNLVDDYPFLFSTITHGVSILLFPSATYCDLHFEDPQEYAEKNAPPIPHRMTFNMEAVFVSLQSNDAHSFNVSVVVLMEWCRDRNQVYLKPTARRLTQPLSGPYH